MPSKHWREKVVRPAKRVVVKIGTSALTDERGRLDAAFLKELAGQVAGLLGRGLRVSIVSSGAVGAGMAELDLSERPKTLPMLQATAAVGQGQLMRHFHDAFSPHGVKVAQLLVTRGDFESRSRYLNIRNTLAALQDVGAVAIVNENDSVAVEELRYGDNDIIAAHITNMLRADVLVLLSVVDGVMRDGQVLDVLENVGVNAASLARPERSKFGSGGMTAKLSAAQMVSAAGEVAIVANARTPDILLRLLDGEQLGTLCVPVEGKMSSRRRWIAQAARSAGKIYVDEGAANALRGKGKSLLPSGITAVAGTFGKGDTVTIVDPRGKPVARGLSNYTAEQVEAIMGLRSSQIAKALGDKPYDEVVHRNNMTVL